MGGAACLLSHDRAGLGTARQSAGALLCRSLVPYRFAGMQESLHFVISMVVCYGRLDVTFFAPIKKNFMCPCMGIKSISAPDMGDNTYYT